MIISTALHFVIDIWICVIAVIMKPCFLSVLQNTEHSQQDVVHLGNIIGKEILQLLNDIYNNIFFLVYI